MKQYNLHFMSKEPCSVFINGNNVGLIDNHKTFFIDIISYTSSLIVSADPVGSNGQLLSNTFRLSKMDNNLISSSTFVKVIPFPLDNFDVILQFAPAPQNKPLLTVFNQNVNGYSVMVTNTDKSIVSIFKNTDGLFSTTCDALSDIKCEFTNNLIVLTAQQGSDDYLIVFDTQSNKALICDAFLKVEKSGSTIKTLKPLNDFFKHGIVNTLNLENMEASNYTVFVENTKANISESLIPYAFLECVKALDYSKAKSYLDFSLGNISNSKLDAYFLEIENIYYNCYFFEPNQTNYTIETTKGFKNYTFSLLNGKICEIEENSL